MTNYREEKIIIFQILSKNGRSAAEIVKPRTDTREYRRIVLRNSLEVLLISDPDTDKVTLSILDGGGFHECECRSFCDPEGFPGLAHFLEHMLFYASEKYPLEDSYSKYIIELYGGFIVFPYALYPLVRFLLLNLGVQFCFPFLNAIIYLLGAIAWCDFESVQPLPHGGSTNAFTSSEHTNYYFDVNSDCFEEALDRFAQFFVKPLMSADATTREIKAVDSENQKNLLSDAWRMCQLQKHISAEGHPYHKFSTGNWDTLEVKPKEKGLDTRHELIKFYEEHYSANLMHLVVYTKESLDKIQSLVEHKFQEIQNKDRSNFQIPGQPCTSEHLQILVKTVPIKQGHKLRVIWPITPSIHNYKEGPCRYLGHLIGHEGEGSLFYILKTLGIDTVEGDTDFLEICIDTIRPHIVMVAVSCDFFFLKVKNLGSLYHCTIRVVTLGWATSLSAGEGDWTCEFSFFKVVIDLTEAGHEHMQDIVGLLFKYISLLQQTGVCKWIFDEAACEGGC
ncbi:Insulin-degrading enzyme-like 1, peroxisomal [Vitis vinifera]|uniref:Insulin-degrading enzyme-like 1, peroxisomal n=1 Tax=Vitis vinifera TaxID=29760 RepID=A0A438JL24_VITVI|nr:Insulin-degrading enzyme-like 1, peroxisomal [Vitis vinifera]